MSPIIPKLKRQKREQHTYSEDEALHKLVEAVLDSPDPSKSRRRRAPTLLRRFRRLKVALARKLRRHPFLLIAVLVGGISSAVLLAGRSSVSNAIADTNQVNTVIASGVERPTGGAGAPSRTGPGSTGSKGSAASARAMASEAGRADIAKDLVIKVTEGDYERPEDVATGRFLLDFQNQWLLLSAVDRTQLLPVRRGRNFVQLTGPYHSTDDWSHRVHLSDERRRRDTSSDAIIRLAKVRVKGKRERVWKLEHIRVY